MEPREEPQAHEPAPAGEAEPRGRRIRRHGHRVRLYTWAVLLVLALVVLIALIAANTRQVRINWVFGHSTAALVWIVVVSAIVGWIAGIATSVLFRRLTRKPR
jgi:uncharacterized integral membrane protein